MLSLTFLEAKVGSLRKTVTPDGITPYPNAAQFKSHIEAVATPEQFHAAIVAHANKGHCLHIGDLLTDLPDWGRRAGLANRNSNLHWIVIDIDGIRGIQIETPLTPERLQNIATQVIAIIGHPAFAHTTCVVQASTKLGLDGHHTSLHLFYLLDGPVHSPQLKNWLRNLNVTSPALATNIRLSSNGHALCFPVDISCADTGRLIYLAPPVFNGVADPFTDADHRFVICKRDSNTLPAADILRTVPNDRAANRIKSELRAAAGFDPREREKLRTLMINGDQIHLLLNPAPGIMRPTTTARGFCYYNFNDGDSSAYYHPEGRPDIIFNFKGEPAFRWQDVDPTGYETYCTANAEMIARVDPINVFMIINKPDDKIYKVWHDHSTMNITTVKSSREAVTDFYTEYGKIEPTFLPTWTIEYNPTVLYQADYTGKTINTFVPSIFMKDGITTPIPNNGELGPDDAPYIASQCPHIWFLLNHVSGNSDTELLHFINWLATLLQCRRKTQTAWIFQGVEGTGKGSLFDAILKPLLGAGNVSMKNNQDLEDNFDAWRVDKLLIVIDEFKIAPGARSEQLLSKLRHWITEEDSSVRAMYAMGKDANLYDNYIFYSNNHNMVQIPESDRRFNVCPRQEVPLKLVCDTDQLHAGIDAELPLFSSLLHAWRYDKVQARTCLRNNAKDIARRASYTSADEFAIALYDGDLDFMLQMLEVITTPEACQLLAHADAQATVMDMVRNRHNSAWFASTSLCTLYNVMFDQCLSTIGFGKMLQRRGTMAERFTDADGMRKRGFLLRMHKTTLTNAELDELVAPATNRHHPRIHIVASNPDDI